MNIHEKKIAKSLLCMVLSVMPYRGPLLFHRACIGPSEQDDRIIDPIIASMLLQRTRTRVKLMSIDVANAFRRVPIHENEINYYSFLIPDTDLAVVDCIYRVWLGGVSLLL